LAARLVDPEAVLETHRLLLEPLLRRHAAKLYAMLRSLEIQRYVPQEPSDTLEALEMCSGTLERRLSTERPNWAVRPKFPSRYIGRVEASVTLEGTASIAYAFSPEIWGSGNAGEACHCVLPSLFENYSVGKVTAEADTRNATSIELLERLGFERVSTGPGAHFFKGVRSDEYAYRLLAPEPG
jgi:ribosomal-protein-alanine N-acetyltransferase